MSMSKRDFIALADIIRDHNRFEDTRFTTKQVTVLAEFCHEQNPNFNRECWLAYIAGECGPNGGAVKVAAK